MPGETSTNDLAALLIGDYIVKLQRYPFQGGGSGVDEHKIIIKKRGVIIDLNFYDRINIAAFLNFLVGIIGITHQRGPAKLEIFQIVGMINHLGTIGVHI